MRERTIGTILMAVGLTGLIGWVNSIEPDCYCSTKVGLQVRLCGENYIGREESAYLWVPAASFVVLLSGVVVRVRARRREAAQHVLDSG